MVAIHLKGRVTESGKLDVELPPGIPVGEVELTLQVITADDAPWTDEELAQALKTNPKTGAEIVAEIQAGLIGDGWSDVTISGAEWVERVRRRNQEEKYKW
jgi:hypothetical protein